MKAQIKTLGVSTGRKPGRDRNDRLVGFCQKLKVFANPRRFAIMLALSEDELSVGEIEQLTGIKQPNLSLELRKLRDSELVSTRRQSKVIFYSIAAGDARAIVLELARQAGVSATSASPVESQSTEPKHDPRVLQLSKVRQGECAHFPSVHRTQPI